MNDTTLTAMEQAMAAPLDPSVTAEAHALSRAQMLVKDMNSGARKIVSDGRDKLDNLLRALDAKGVALAAAIDDYGLDCGMAVKMAETIIDPIDRAAKQVGQGLSPAPGATLTQT